jgi:phage gpG-like protein
MIKISVQGVEGLERIAGGLEKVLESPLLHKRAATILIADARRNIDAGGYPEKFVPLAPSTKLNRLRKQFRSKGGIYAKTRGSKALRTRKGVVEAAQSMKILRDTGNLYHQMNYDSSEGKTFYIGVVDYLMYHQSDEPRRKLPQRKVFQPTRSTFKEIEQTISEYLSRQFQS